MKKLKTKRAYWQEHVNNWKESGLSQKSYCNRENISSSTFSSWSKSLTASSSERISFVEVECRSSSVKTSTQDTIPDLQMILGNGVRIFMGSKADTNLIQQVLNFAGSL